MKTDVLFKKDLNASRIRVSARVSDLCSRGLHAEMCEHIDRPNSAVRMQYGDDGDFFICGRVEHKIRKLHFTCCADFPYDTLIVDEKYKVDARVDAVLAYIIENQTGTCAAVVYGWQREHWKVERRFDRIANRSGDFYVIDKNLVRFCRPENALI